MKPRLHLFIISVVSTLCFSSCNKIDTAGPTIADGKIVDATTGAGIPNATALLMRKTSGSVSSIDRTQMETQITDANGHFHFEFDAEGGFTYTVEGSAIHYEEVSEGGRLTSGRKNENMKVSISPKAYLFIKLINEAPLDTKDIVISGYFNPQITLPHYSKDSFFYRDALGNKENIVNFITNTVDGKKTEQYKLICPALDTTEITLKY
jgi:hypothetical protein